jgi:DHA1 family multidrug resistance protein-like MFS transporter
MSRRSITVISLAGYFLVGSIPIMLAPALPFLIRAFNLTLTSAGAVFVARSAGSFLGVMIGGTLSDRLGRKPVIIIGCFLQGFLMALVAISPNWFLITAFFALIGLAGGLINPSINAMIAEVNSERRGAALNALHGVYSVGAMVGPLVAGILLASRYGWRAIFFGGCVIWILYGLVLL